MYEATRKDKRYIAIGDMIRGNTFIYRDHLMMKTSSDFVKYEDMYYGVVIQSPDNEVIGKIWMFSPDTLVEPVNVNANFTIVE